VSKGSNPLNIAHIGAFALAVFMGGLMVGYVFGMAKGLRVFAQTPVDPSSCP
jgi:hypothetical protein